MYFAGSPFESAGTAAVATGGEAVFAGWAGPFSPAAIRIERADGKKRAAQSARRGQYELGAISIRKAGRVCRLIIVFGGRKSTPPRCLFRSVARKGNGRLFTRRWAASTMQENPFHTLRRANRIARHLSMRDAAP